MAKKKSKKTSHRRRRSVGALALNPTSPLMMYGPIALGYFMADKINAPIDKAIGDKIDKKIVAGAEVGLGGLLVFSKGKKSMVKNIVGGLLLGAGAKRALHEFGIGAIGGYGAVPVIGRPVYRMNGYGAVPVIGGYSPNGTLNGYPVPRRSSVMGCASNGSGISTGSQCMG